MSLQIRVAKAQGDPGLFGFLGKAVGTIAKVGTSFIPGPAGAIARGLTSRIFGGGGAVAPAAARPLPTVIRTMAPLINGAAGPNAWGVSPVPNVVFPESRGFGRGQDPGQFIPATGEVGFDTTPAIGCPSGYKPNKSGYYRRIKSPGNPEGSVYYIAPKSRCVKIRKRNAANPRAADRALNRIQSAKRFATKMNRVTIRKKCD